MGTGLFSAATFGAVTFVAGHFLCQPLKKIFEIGSVLKTPKKDNFFRFSFIHFIFMMP